MNSATTAVAVQYRLKEFPNIQELVKRINK